MYLLNTTYLFIEHNLFIYVLNTLKIKIRTKICMHHPQILMTKDYFAYNLQTQFQHANFREFLILEAKQQILSSER